MLANLRQTLADHLVITRDTLALNRASSYWLDVEQLEAALADPQPVATQQLQEAAALYTGDFLRGFVVRDAPLFDEWVSAERERLRQRALHTLHTLADTHTARGEYAAGIDACTRLLQFDPWREDAHRQLMLLLALSGQRDAALAQYGACSRMLKEEFDAEPDPETTALYDQIRAGKAPASSSGRPSALPIALTPLLGRADERDQLVQLLADPARRLVTLVGPGGIGKTRLALEVATELRDAVAEIFFVDLAPISDAGMVAATIARSLAVREAPDQSLLDGVKNELRDTRALLLLDNFEHVIAAAPLVAELLAECSNLTVLATSRHELHLRGEHVFPVPTLALPDERSRTEPAHLVAYAAVALFVERATQHQPSFVLAAENAAAVVEICRRLDGLPLAIELAAARIRLFPPAALLQRLSNRLDLLTRGPHDLPPRQQTLQNTLDWSYNLLGEAEQTLFAQLAVFVGGWTLAAAEAVCRTGVGHGAGLQSLIDNSLVRRTVDDNGEPRFTMLETIREYGGERLRRSGEAELVRSRHAAHYLQLVEHAAPELAGGSAQVVWFGRVGAELNNIRVALRWSVERAEAEIALRLSVALREFWMTRALLSEGRSWLEAALALGKRAAEPVDDGLRCNALTAAGWLAANARDYAAANARFEQSLLLVRRSEEPAQIIAVLGDLAQALRMQGDTERAATLYRERLALCREEGDGRGVAWSLCNLGIIAHDADDAAAEPLLEEGVAASHGASDRICRAWCMTFLARVAKDHGQYAQSAAAFSETVKLFRDVGHTDGIAFTLEGWAGLAVSMGELRSAARIFGAAEALREAINRPQPLYQRDAATAAASSSLAWRAAWAEGRALSAEQAIAYVLQHAPVLAASPTFPLL